MVRNQLEPKGADDLHVVQRVVRAGCVDNGGSKQGSSYKELQKSAGSALTQNRLIADWGIPNPQIGTLCLLRAC